MDGRELVERLRRVVGDRWLLLDEHDLRTYESDGLLQYQQVPRLAVLPGTGDEVRECVAACAEAGVPWVARGAGSGLSGGALPVKDGVLIVLSRLNRILEVDLDNGRVCVEPGVTNAAVSAAVAPDFFYPPDPSSQVVCTIGGNVAENSGGAHCFKYGFTTNYVTGLEVVLRRRLAACTIGGKELDTPGYDLLGAFVGSEGTLGVATKIWLRVVPVPEATRTLVAFFDSTRQAGEAVSAIVQAGIVPGAIEMMDATTIRATEADGARRLPGRPGRGAAGRARRRRGRVRRPVRRGHRDLLPSRAPTTCGSAATRPSGQLFWKTRKAAFPAMGRISPNYFVQDGVVPRTTLPDVLVRIDELAAEYGLVVANVFHAGDGNLHPLVCFDAAVEGQAARAEELAGRILDVCLEAGGSITGEHGVGVDKRKHMAQDVRRGRPGRVPAAALRVRPGRPAPTRAR